MSFSFLKDAVSDQQSAFSSNKQILAMRYHLL